MKKTSKHWSKNALNALRELWETGGSVSKFARQYHRTVASVRQMALRRGFPKMPRFKEGPSVAEYTAKLQQECDLWGVSIDLVKPRHNDRPAAFVRAKTFKYFLDGGYTKTGIAIAAGVHHTTVMYSEQFLVVWTDERFRSWLPGRGKDRRNIKIRKITHAALIDNYNAFSINRGQQCKSK